jgi:hypothetical protein
MPLESPIVGNANVAFYQNRTVSSQNLVMRIQNNPAPGATPMHIAHHTVYDGPPGEIIYTLAPGDSVVIAITLMYGHGLSADAPGFFQLA